MLLLSLIFAFLAYEGQSYYAIASFGDGDPSAAAIGNVTVMNGTVSVYLDLSNGYEDGVFDYACLSGGFTWHIHTQWNNDSTTWGTYDACSAAMTAFHYDPLAACGGNTDYALCTQRGGCLPAGLGLGFYWCNPSSFDEYPLACEIGDWSGKYGRVYASNGTNTTFMGSWSSFFEVDADLLVNQSVVFHCSGQRALCAAFEVMGDDTMEYKPDQPDMKTVEIDFSNAIEWYDSNYDDTSLNLMQANGDGSWSYDFSFSSAAQSDLQSDYGSCVSSGLDFYVFSEWNAVENSLWGEYNCKMATGGYSWDPTNQCLPMSGSYYCSNSTQCNGNPNNSTYNCSSDVAYSCAPGDLSGRWGTLDAVALTSGVVTVSGMDSELPNLDSIVGGSVAVLCSGEFVMCGRIQDVSEAVATATFGGSLYTNLSGEVTVTNQEITINIDAPSYVDLSDLCPTTNYLLWHIHQFWDHDDTMSRWKTDCSGTYTGGHYDPYNGCGGATDNQWCSTKSTAGLCDTVGNYVNSSSFNPSARNTYSCDDFDTYPYACEVGDWSGKYGTALLVSVPDGTYYIEVSESTSSQYAEVRATDLIGKSIVFHCADDSSRVFCAPFEVSGTDGNDLPPSAANTSSNQYIVSYLDNTSYVKIYEDNYVEIIVNATNFINTCEDGTNDYRISLYNDWTGMAQYNDNDVCNNNFGTFYDPGYTCPPQISNDECTCILTQSDYNYTCNYNRDKFSCAAGDLSGRFGTVPDNQTFYAAGYDLNLPPLNMLENLALVLECNDDDYYVIACSGFDMITFSPTMMTSNPTSNPTMTTSDPTSNPTSTPTDTTFNPTLMTSNPSPAPVTPTMAPSQERGNDSYRIVTSIVSIIMTTVFIIFVY